MSKYTQAAKKKREQDALYNAALQMAYEARLIENALRAAEWAERQKRIKDAGNQPQGKISSWLLP